MYQSIFSNFKTLSDLSLGFKKVAKQKELQSSRFSILNGKIEKYRERQAEAKKKSEKSNETKMRELQKQQQSMLSPADQMRENFNAFANMNFAGNNSAAIPGIKAIPPITNKMARIKLAKKLANIRKKLATTPVQDPAQSNNAVAQQPVQNNNVAQPSAQNSNNAAQNNVSGQATDKNDYENYEKMVSDSRYPLAFRHALMNFLIENKLPKNTTFNDYAARYGSPLIQALGLGRSDNNISNTEFVNLYSSPNSRLGNLRPYDTSVNRLLNIG